MRAWNVVAQETQSGRVAVGDPEIQVPILIPVHQEDGSTINGEIESAGSGDIGESTSCGARGPRVQETTVPLVTAERSTLPHHLVEVGECILRRAYFRMCTSFSVAI